MANRNFTFVNAEGLLQEELASITTGGTATDSGKLLTLNSNGKVDGTLIQQSAIDHGALLGLGDDDHTQYTLVDGSRAFTGDQSMGTNQLTSVGDPVTVTIDGATDDAVPMSFLASTVLTEGAALIGINDTQTNFSSVNVEGALQELFSNATVQGVNYTAGTGGVTIGDLVEIEANDTAIPLVATTSNKRGIGVANATAGSAVTFTALASDEVVSGVLTGISPTAGDTVYWGTASVLTLAQPSTSGVRVWEVGSAKNGGDLHVDIRFIKRNA